jgi:N-acetylmuramoyl-L-alanine amidase
MQTVVIDPGHNGGNSAHAAEINRLVNAVSLRKPCDTTGTETDAGYTESAFDLDVARRLATILRASGDRVVLTRSTDDGWGPCITQRAAIGNVNHADAAISIHADGGPAAGRGFHVIEPGLIRMHTERIVEPSKRLGLDVRDAYRAATGLPYATYLGRDGIDVRTDLGGLNLSRVPKVFVECGNMRNSLDAALLSDGAFRQRIATGLAAGIEAFLAGR